MTFPIAERITAPKPCVLLPSQKTLHVRKASGEPPMEGPSGSLGPRWGVMTQLEEANFLVPCVRDGCGAFMAVLGLLLGDGGSHSRKEPLFQL